MLDCLFSLGTRQGESAFHKNRRRVEILQGKPRATSGLAEKQVYSSIRAHRSTASPAGLIRMIVNPPLG
jgi:hypothetical protein